MADINWDTEIPADGKSGEQVKIDFRLQHLEGQQRDIIAELYGPPGDSSKGLSMRLKTVEDSTRVTEERWKNTEKNSTQTKFMVLGVLLAMIANLVIAFAK